MPLTGMRVGVTPTVVKQRLKLGAVSPKLMALYRKAEMSLDQLSAFAITEDYEKQERVWKELPSYHRNREAILSALSDGQVRSDDRRALFVGMKAYEEAGGTIIRDLFDDEGGGFFADAELLNRLAHEMLQAHAEIVRRQAGAGSRRSWSSTTKPQPECAAYSRNGCRCPGASASGYRPSEAIPHADTLARETGLDMTAYWQPTGVNYLTRVSKERILEALREGGQSDVETIARLKKPAMAAAAEAALLGKGWLPQLLRTPVSA